MYIHFEVAIKLLLSQNMPFTAGLIIFCIKSTKNSHPRHFRFIRI